MNHDRAIELMAGMLCIEDLYLHRGDQSLGPFTHNIAVSERIAILGPSGAGKSSLLHALAGDLKPSAGSIDFYKRPLGAWPMDLLSQKRAVLLQQYDATLDLPVRLMIALGRVARREDREQQDAIVTEAARMAQAAHFLDKNFSQLSGGEQSRVHLARTFAQLWDSQQGIVLVDEPLASLDPGLQQHVIVSLTQFAQSRQHALVAILHHPYLALQYFQRLWLMRAGRVVYDVSTQDKAQAHMALEDIYGCSLGKYNA